jgi:uncharacterized protein (DUF2141 family)
MVMLRLAFLTALLAADAGTPTATIEVELKDHANKGTLWIALHNDKGAFPSKHERAVQRHKVKVTGVPMTIKLENVIFSVVHDENDNGEIDRGFFGIPKEGYGVSNNSTGFGAFSYDAAKFKLDKPLLRQSIMMRRP